MATIKCKGLTGVTFDLTVTMGSTTMNGLTALAQTVEGSPITTGMYGEIFAAKDPNINQTNDGAKTLTAAGLIDGDVVICVSTANSVNSTLNKEQRADQKGAIAQAKREGLAAGDTMQNTIEQQTHLIKTDYLILTKAMTTTQTMMRTQEPYRQGGPGPNA
jgi:hypothetical protein